MSSVRIGVPMPCHGGCGSLSPGRGAALVLLVCVVWWGEASSRGREVCWGHGPPSSPRAQCTCAQCDCHLEEGSVCPTSIRAFASLTRSANCRGKDQASSYIGISNWFSNSEFVELEKKWDFSIDLTWPALPWSEPRAGVPGGHFLTAPLPGLSESVWWAMRWACVAWFYKEGNRCRQARKFN